MANWYGSSRSNYFRVKDDAVFRVWAAARQLNTWTNEKGLYAISPHEFSDGEWPSIDPETGDYFDLHQELSKHLTPNSVAVLQTIGSEKLRYLTGHATAIAHTGETVCVDINDIYTLAQDEFGGDVEITEAVY